MKAERFKPSKQPCEVYGARAPFVWMIQWPKTSVNSTVVKMFLSLAAILTSNLKLRIHNGPKRLFRFPFAVE